MFVCFLAFQCLEIPIIYDVYESGDCSPEYEFPPRPTLQVAAHGSPLHSSQAEGAEKKTPSDRKGFGGQVLNNKKKKGVGIRPSWIARDSLHPPVFDCCDDGVVDGDDGDNDASRDVWECVTSFYSFFLFPSVPSSFQRRD